MKLSVGFVGLPNVGKSTLFNAVTNSAVDAENFPFCTISPNTGIVPLEDPRLTKLAAISNSSTILPATVTFTDIAGLVKGAASGEGLGNQFLSSIRETAVIAHVVRCFDEPNIVHVHGKIDPKTDVDIICLELILSDLEIAKKSFESLKKRSKSSSADILEKLTLVEKICHHLESGFPVRSIQLSPDEIKLIADFSFLTAKPMIYIGNVLESDFGKKNRYIDTLTELATQENTVCIEICAKLESEISKLDPSDKPAFFELMGINQSGLSRLTSTCFDYLNLQTYLTTGPKETRAWTIQKGWTAPMAAGVIHSDFEKGFIRANIVNFDDFIKFNGFKGAKDAGVLRQEGKEYIMRDGDIVEFLFNV